MLDRPRRRAAIKAALTQYSPGYHIGRRPPDDAAIGSTLLFGLFMVILIGAIPSIANIIDWVFG